MLTSEVQFCVTSTFPFGLLNSGLRDPLVHPLTLLWRLLIYRVGSDLLSFVVTQ